MIKAKKTKSFTKSKAPLVTDEMWAAQIAAAKARARDNAAVRATLVQRSAKVLREIVGRAAEDGVFVSGIMAGPVRVKGKSPPSAGAPKKSKAMVVYKRPK